METKKWIVYRHTSPNGKVYIGITSRGIKRWSSKDNSYKNNPHFRTAIKKYGWKRFKHEILYSNLNKISAITIEIDLIYYYKSINNCYNITDGGEGCLGCHTKRHSKEFKLALSQRSSGENNYFYGKSFKGELHPMYGKHHTEESKTKMSNSKNSMKKQVGQYTIDGELIKSYSCIREAERQTGVLHHHISGCCRELPEHKTAGGFKWKFI